MNRARIWSWQHRAAPWLFVSPFIILFCVFMLYPLARSVLLSLHTTSGPRRMAFVGLDNFVFLLRDRLFWWAALNTAMFTIAFLLIQVPASLGLAMLLNHPRLRGRRILRLAYFSPYLVGPVFVAILFGQILAPRHGLLAEALGWLGIRGEIDMLHDPSLAMLGVLIAALWLSIGYGMIYFLAALQAVDQGLYEAAAIDGAGRWSRFWHITLPGIRPILAFMIVVGTIAGLQLFELPWVMFGGPGPGGAGLTVVMYLFLVGWGTGDLGYASAVGWALVVLICVAAAIQLRLSGLARER
jgi:ABC-type sugar transport system permease subunit